MKDVIDVLAFQDHRERHRKLFDYRLEDDSFTGVRFLFECGVKLNLRPTTMTTAAYIFHKFFSETTLKNYDIFLIATTCLFMASKIQDDAVKLRDVLNVSYGTLFRGSSPLELDNRYWSMRDAIIQAELLIMRMIKFQFTIADPQKYLLQYYRTLRGWLHPEDSKELSVIQNAIAFLTDFHHDSTIINYKPEHVAVACLFLVLQCYGVVIPETGSNEASWFTVFDPELTKEKVWEIAERIMDCYDRESKDES